MKNSIVITCMILFYSFFSANAQKKVTFKLSNAPTGSQISIRGNSEPLNWDTSYPLVQDDQGNYMVELEFSSEVKTIEYKYVIEKGDKVEWENIDNRSFAFDKAILEDSWNQEAVLDISSFDLLSPKELEEDLEILKSIVKIHPGYGRHQSEEAVDKIVRNVADQFINPKSLGECYRDLSLITAALQCDHTKVGMNNQDARINSIIHRQADKVPFSFHWIDGKMILRRDASYLNLPRGSEILSINGQGVEGILTALLPYVAADGHTDKNRIFKLEVNGYDFRYNYFDVFFPLVYKLDNKIAVTYKKPGSEIIEQDSVSLLTREDRSNLFLEKYSDFPATRDDFWDFSIEEDRSLGILTINSYGLMGWKAMSIDYKAFLADAFEQLKAAKIQNLVIDIRENTGGMDEMKQEIFSYLEFDRNKFKKLNREFKSRYIDYPEELKAFTKTWGSGNEPSFYSLKADEVRGANEFVFKERDLRRYKAKRNRFKGEVYLLTSEANTSLAYYTAADFKYSEIGISIGRETGGNVQGISGGQLAFITLPNSGILVESSLIGEYSNLGKGNHGVLPDIKVDRSIDAIVANRDLEMEKVYEILDQQAKDK